MQGKLTPGCSRDVCGHPSTCPFSRPFEEGLEEEIGTSSRNWGQWSEKFWKSWLSWGQGKGSGLSCSLDPPFHGEGRSRGQAQQRQGTTQNMGPAKTGLAQ